MDKLTSDTNLQFIRDRIYNLQTAIMYSMSNELIKIPNSLVTVVRIDEEGNLWFHCKALVQYVHQYEQSFPVRLHFFRKGMPYFVEVSGSAVIVKGQQYDSGEADAEKTLLIKMDINAAEYAEPHVRKKSWLDMMMENGYNWLVRTLTIPRTVKPVLAKLQQGNSRQHFK